MFISQNPNKVPFQNNHLINQNVHVINNLNNLIEQHRTVKKELPAAKQRMDTLPKNLNRKKTNIIEEMLKPRKIIKENKDVAINYESKVNQQKLESEMLKQHKPIYKMTNMPYKNIIKDRVIDKNVDDISVNDIVVHKVVKEIDADIKKFNNDLDNKKESLEQVNKELEVEYHESNYDKHKKRYEFNETFIRNLTYEENTFDENKADYIEFYNKRKKEAEEGQRMCDHILKSLTVNDDVINKNEIPESNIN